MKPFDPDERCPKCQYDAVTTTYYPPTAHKDCPLYGQNYIIAQNVSPLAFSSEHSKSIGPERTDQMRQTYFQRMTADEHFDRRCARCGHSWVEALPVKEPVSV